MAKCRHQIHEDYAPGIVRCISCQALLKIVQSDVDTERVEQQSTLTPHPEPMPDWVLKEDPTEKVEPKEEATDG